jgi:hypothetical protein
MQYPDASGVPVNMLPISDGSVFDQLKLLVDSEGTHLAEPDWLGMMASVGIVKGQPFNPDAQTRAILRWVNPIADGTSENPGGPLDLAWRRKDGGYLDLDTRICAQIITSRASQYPGLALLRFVSEQWHGV